MLPLAAQVMAIRNPLGVPLDLAQKGYLRPLFGNLVEGDREILVRSDERAMVSQ